MSAMPEAKAIEAVGEIRHLSQPAQEFMPSPVASVVATMPASTPVGEKYSIDIVFDYDRHFLTVEENIAYSNRTKMRLDYLTLAVAANLSPDCFDLINLAVNNTSVTEYSLNKQRLDVPLPTPLEPDSAVQLTLRYTLSLPYLDQFNRIDAPVFGYTDMQTNLINWYPFIVPFVNGEWILHDPWRYGDYLAYSKADYTVNLLFVDRENEPVVAASGSAERIVDFTR
jgi:hypothetical protein